MKPFSLLLSTAFPFVGRCPDAKKTNPFGVLERLANRSIGRCGSLLCIYGLIALLPLHALAQKDTLELQSVAVQGVRAGVRSPFAKISLDDSTIRSRNTGQDLPFLLRSTPSVVVSSDAGTGVGYTGIRIRGTDPGRINVTLNGVPFNDPESGGSFFVNLPDFLSSVQSVQIQRGVGSSSNGAGAFGGSIHLTTGEAQTKRSELAITRGSYDTWKSTLRYQSGVWGKGWSAEGRISSITSGGYIERSAATLRSAYGSIGFAGRRHGLRLMTFTGSEKTGQAWYGVPEAVLKANRRFNSAGTERPGEPYENETDNYRQSHYQLHYSGKNNGGWQWQAVPFLVRGKGYYEQYRADQPYARYGLLPTSDGRDSFSRSDLVRQLWLNNYFFGSTFNLQYLRGGTEFTLGGAATGYQGAHYGRVPWAANGLQPERPWYDLDSRKADANLYAKWSQAIHPHWRLYTDLQYRRVSYRTEGFRDNPTLAVRATNHFFNPKIGLHYLKGFWSGYASFGVAQKEPNRDDFEAATTEVPRAEKLYDWEGSLAYTNGANRFSLGLYHMYYRDQLVLTGRINDVGAYTRTNIDRSHRTGVEAEMSLRLNAGLTAWANLTLSRNRILDFTEYIDDWDAGGQLAVPYRNTPIAFSPHVIANAGLQWQAGEHTTLYTAGKFTSRQYLDNTGDNACSLDAFLLQDLGVRHGFRLAKTVGLLLKVEIQNLWDAMYEPNGYTYRYRNAGAIQHDNYYYPMAGRQVFFTAAFDLTYPTPETP